MARISLLPLADALTGDEVVPGVQTGRTRRITLASIAALAAAMLPALTKGDRGDPGATTGAVGLFTAIATTNIPAGVDAITTTGHGVKGFGRATYVSRDAPVIGGRVAALATPWRTQSADGRWWQLSPSPYVTFDQLGAIGRPNAQDADIKAWKTISAWLAENDGGGLQGRTGATYAVGDQTYVGTTVWAFEPAPVIKGEGLTGAVIIDALGCRLRCRDGLRYGAFEPSGAPTPGHTEAVFPNGSKRSSPYSGMIEFFNCSGSITVSNIVLDGNQQGVVLGGTYGDTGFQIPSCGLNLLNNTGGITLRNILAIDHPQDGGQIQSHFPNLAAPSANIVMEDVTFDRNGRQGFSMIGGRGLTATNCKFNRTGYGRIYTNPGAGFDMEAESGNLNRDSVFINCEFFKNRGQSFVADSGDSGDATFIHCRFVGGGFWVVWPRKPGIKFIDCRIVGSMPSPWDDGGVASNRSTQFIRCEITNDPAYGLTQEIDPFLINGGAYGTAALFERCEFRAVGPTRLMGLAGVTTRFESCRFVQGTTVVTPLRGVFTGDNVAVGVGISRADEAIVYDRFILNGVKQAVSV